MSDLRDLYQEVILDHNRRPRNFGRLPDATSSAVGHNPLCGDRLSLGVRLDGDRLSDIRFEGSGCAISKASASLMTETVKGRTTGEVEALFDEFQRLVTGQSPTSTAPPVDLGKLAVFAGVSEFPLRVKCATLSWHTLKAALRDPQATVSTE